MPETHNTARQPEPKTERSRKEAAASSEEATRREPRSFDERGEQERHEREERDTASAGHAEPDRGQVQPEAQAGRQNTVQVQAAGRQVGTALRQAFDPFMAMQHEMSRFMDDVLRQTLGFRAAPASDVLRAMGGFRAAGLFGLPPADLKETDKAHVICVELPGLAREDVDVSLSEDAIVVAGHKAETHDGSAAAYRISERRFGRFERAFPLPADVDRDHVSAEFKDGVLTVTLPKSAGAGPRRSRVDIR